MMPYISSTTLNNQPQTKPIDYIYQDDKATTILERVNEN